MDHGMLSGAVDVRADVRARVAALMAKANDARRVRILCADAAMRLIERVAAGAVEWAVAHGGAVGSSYRYPAETTVALAARVGGRVYFGAARCDARGASVGRAWYCLQPWRDSGPRGDVAAKWAAWAASPGVIRVEDFEVGALLETMER